MMEFSSDKKLGEIQDDYRRADLIAATEAMTGYLLGLVGGLPDAAVTFEPQDPAAHDPYAATDSETAMPWTLGHVVVHITASCEEACARGSSLARGVAIRTRSRWEVPWESVTTTAQVVHRLEESHRMQMAFLNTWPDSPHLDVTYDKYEEYWGKLNAVGMTLSGLHHAADHYEQIGEIIRQFEAAN